MSDVQRFNNEVQRAGKDGFDAAVSSFGEANKGFQAIAAEIAAYSRNLSRTAPVPLSNSSARNHSSKRSRSSLSTPKRRLMLTLPRQRS